ncbi:MAG: hypothetical protein PHE32_04040 [Candidatus Shapirobacteria bacterium]|nr:hypothetical protein [Candidatus Shapirobacteria bacterium]
MAIKNAYTKQSLEDMIREIQKTLISHNAKKIMFDYDNGKLSGLAFCLELNGRMCNFKLPAKIQECEAILKKQGLYNPSKVDHALRVAWANIRDWIASQMAMIDLNQVKIEEVFLPYLLMGEKTLFEMMEVNSFALPSGE